MPAETVKKPRTRSESGAGKSPTIAELKARIAELEAKAPGKAHKAAPDDNVVLLNLSRNPITIIPSNGGQPVRIGPGPVKDEKIKDEYEVSAVVKRADVTGPAWDAMVKNREIEIRNPA